MAPKTIGFATSARYRDLTEGDLLAAAELRHRGLPVVPLVWTELPANDVNCDVVVLRSVWDYHLHADRFLDWVASLGQRSIVFNHPEMIRWNADKRYIFDLQRAGLPVPNTRLIEAGGHLDLENALLQLHGPKAVIKPAISASAYETYLVDLDNAATLPPRINELLQSRSMLIQDFVPEIVSRGEWSLMFFGGRYSHAMRKVPHPGDFRVQNEHGGIHTSENPPAEIFDLAQRAASEFAADTLYARIDLVEERSRPLIMEVEIIDPELFLAFDPRAAARFSDALMAMCESQPITKMSAL